VTGRAVWRPSRTFGHTLETMLETRRSTCPFDCPDACGLVVETDGRSVRSVRGDPEHDYTRGTLCPKVNGFERTVHAPGRLLHPLIRTGAKGQGAFRRASWDEAATLIADRWQALIAAHGRECILPYTYAGTMGLIQRNAQEPLMHRLGASLLDRTICTSAQNAGWEQVMGHTPGSDPEDAVHSDLLFLWGINALATNIHFLTQVKAVRRNGGRVFLIDTHRQASAAYADRVFLVRPGSDGALALGMLHLLVRENRVDREFLAREAVGWDELERQILPEHPPERTAALTGLSVEDVVFLAREFGTARAPFIRLGGAPSRYGNGGLNTRATICLPTAVGAWAKKGGGLLSSTNSGQAFDLRSFVRPDLLPGRTRIVNMNRLGHALNELDGPRVMSLFVASSNPAAVAPDQNAVLRGLSREDLFTVVHERFMTDTALYADVVLPAPTMLETADLYRAYGHFYAQRVRPVIPPLGESRSNWETIRTLARAMGLTDDVFQLSADEHIELILSRPTSWLQGVDLDALNAGHAVRLNVPRGKWLTPSGKIEIKNERLPEPVPRHRPTHADLDGEALPLRLQTAPALYRLNSSFTERAELSKKLGAQTLRLSPADATARRLTNGQRVTGFNAQGEVSFVLEVTDAVPPGIAVAEGVHSIQQGNARNVNGLTSQRLADTGGGSTFYDNRIDVRAAG
jgi:anaerobic selenocysteine-containing dehydrogenase